MPNVRSPDMGLEPMTLRLKVWCSTDWANRAPCWSSSKSWLVKRIFDWYLDWIVYIKKSLKKLFLDLNKSKQIGAVKARCDINLVTFPFSNSSCHFQQTKMQIKKKLLFLYSFRDAGQKKCFEQPTIFTCSKWNARMRLYKCLLQNDSIARYGTWTHDPQIKSLMLYRLS